jgi:hypothetical protein
MRETNPSDMPAPTLEFFQALEERRTRALVERDMAVLEELHARNYQLITPAGRTYTRERYLAAVKAEPFYAEWEVGQVAVRVSADMAIVRYRARLRFPSGREIVCWHTDSYEKSGGRWQAVWSQATEIRSASGQSSAPAGAESHGS